MCDTVIVHNKTNKRTGFANRRAIVLLLESKQSRQLGGVVYRFWGVVKGFVRGYLCAPPFLNSWIHPLCIIH